MNLSPLESRAQEAKETAAQTRLEASQGDVQARLKIEQIAKLQAQAAPQPAAAAAADASVAAPSVPPPPSGAVINVKR